jgi:hypothetical protein
MGLVLGSGYTRKMDCEGGQLWKSLKGKSHHHATYISVCRACYDYILAAYRKSYEALLRCSCHICGHRNAVTLITSYIV